MSKQIRMAILDQNDIIQAYIDNYNPDSATFYDDTLHEYLQGTAATLSFTSLSRHADTKYLVVGNKLAYTDDGKDYYFNIQVSERDNTYVKVEAYSLSFELLNEQVGKYTAPGAMSFVEYLDVFDYENVITLGLNEVSDKRITCTWDDEPTLLARLFSLAYWFSAELEFVPTLNTDHSLKAMTLNVYKENSSSYQGVGTDRSDMVLRYEVNISGIRKTSDITDLYTAILLFGKDGLTLEAMDRSITDDNGNQYFTSPGDGYLRAPNSRDRFPSSTAKTNDRYINHFGTYDTENIEVLWGESLYQLIQNCTPKVTYVVDGYVDAKIGDTVYMEDAEHTPVMYLKARVSEQQRSYTNPSQNKTTFSNFKEEQSQISAGLLAAMQTLVDAKRTYTCSMLTDNGIFFKNGLGTTTLVASILDGGSDMTDTLSIVWYKDGIQNGTGKTLLVLASSIDDKSVYRYEAYSSTGILRGQYEVTITNIEDAITMVIASSEGSAFKNGSVNTVLSVTIYMGSLLINNYATLLPVLGPEVDLEWSVKKKGETTFTVIPANSPMLTENGFKLQVVPADVNPLSVYNVKLVVT